MLGRAPKRRSGAEGSWSPGAPGYSHRRRPLACAFGVLVQAIGRSPRGEHSARGAGPPATSDATMTHALTHLLRPSTMPSGNSSPHTNVCTLICRQRALPCATHMHPHDPVDGHLGVDVLCGVVAVGDHCSQLSVLLALSLAGPRLALCWTDRPDARPRRQAQPRAAHPICPRPRPRARPARMRLTSRQHRERSKQVTSPQHVDVESVR